MTVIIEHTSQTVSPCASTNASDDDVKSFSDSPWLVSLP